MQNKKDLKTSDVKKYVEKYSIYKKEILEKIEKNFSKFDITKENEYLNEIIKNFTKNKEEEVKKSFVELQTEINEKFAEKKAETSLTSYLDFISNNISNLSNPSEKMDKKEKKLLVKKIKKVTKSFQSHFKEKITKSIKKIAILIKEREWKYPKKPVYIGAKISKKEENEIKEDKKIIVKLKESLKNLIDNKDENVQKALKMRDGFFSRSIKGNLKSLLKNIEKKEKEFETKSALLRKVTNVIETDDDNKSIISASQKDDNYSLFTNRTGNEQNSQEILQEQRYNSNKNTYIEKLNNSNNTEVIYNVYSDPDQRSLTKSHSQQYLRKKLDNEGEKRESSAKI